MAEKKVVSSGDKHPAAISREKTTYGDESNSFFEDKLLIEGTVNYTVATGPAWLFEFYLLTSGTVQFVKRWESISSASKSFAVLFPPFSLSHVVFTNVKGRVFGYASTNNFPRDLPEGSILIETDNPTPPKNIAEILHILDDAQERRSIEANPNPSWLTRRAKKLIDMNYNANPAIGQIASRLGVSHPHLSRQFKRNFLITATEYLHKLRISDAMVKLREGEPILDVSMDVGYNDVSRFYEQFRKNTNSSPGFCQTK